MPCVCHAHATGIAQKTCALTGSHGRGGGQRAWVVVVAPVTSMLWESRSSFRVDLHAWEVFPDWDDCLFRTFCWGSCVPRWTDYVAPLGFLVPVEREGLGSPLCFTDRRQPRVSKAGWTPAFMVCTGLGWLVGFVGARPGKQANKQGTHHPGRYLQSKVGKVRTSRIFCPSRHVTDTRTQAPCIKGLTDKGKDRLSGPLSYCYCAALPCLVLHAEKGGTQRNPGMGDASLAC